MPNIRPVSDLRNYKSVLDDVSYGSPVYLAKTDGSLSKKLRRDLDYNEDHT